MHAWHCKKIVRKKEEDFSKEVSKKDGRYTAI